MMRKWTIIDTIIVLIVAVVVAAGVKVFMDGTVEEETGKVEIVVLADNKEIGFADAVKVGEPITISLSEKDSGVVTKVDTKASTLTSFNSAKGIYYEKSLNSKEDVYIYIEADCIVNDKAVRVGDTVLKVGEFTSVRGKGYATECHIVGVNPGGETNE